MDSLPEGAIPEDQFVQLQAKAEPSAPPPVAEASPSPTPLPLGAIPEEEFKAQLQEPSSASGIAKTAIEQGLSGLTLGASKVLETQGIPAIGIPPITTPEAVAQREHENPGTALISNIAGTAAGLVGSGGAGLLPETASLAARLFVRGLQGGAIAGVNQLTDDWSQNKPLDAQKIAASAGLGALLGGALPETFSTTSAVSKKIGVPLVKAAGKVAHAFLDHSPVGLVLKAGKAVTPEFIKDGVETVLTKTSEGLQNQVEKYNSTLDRGIQTLFTSSTSQVRE